MRTPVAAFLEAATCVAPEAGHAQTAAAARAKLEADPSLAAANAWTAAVTGNVQALRRFVSASPAAAAKVGGPRRWAPLSYLCFSRFLASDRRRSGDFARCAKMLLDAGADVHTAWTNPEDRVKESALYGAAGVANNALLTRVLLEAGADVNDHEALYHALEFSGAEATRVVRLLLAAKPRRRWVTYCLFHQLDFENAARVKVFVAGGADVNFLNDRGAVAGSRPLHFALLRGRGLRVIQSLVQAGADVNGLTRDGRTPLSLALRLGRTEVAAFLKKRGGKADLSARDEFLAACMAANGRRARALLAKTPRMLHGLHPDDAKLLTHAAAAGNLRAVKLMTTLGFDLEVRGDWKGTALHHAAWHGHLETAAYLLARGARTDALNHWGGDVLHTAIHAATHEGHAQGAAIVSLIARHVGAAGITKKHVAAAREREAPAIMAALTDGQTPGL